MSPRTLKSHPGSHLDNSAEVTFFNERFERIKKASGVKKDSELAKILGIKQPSVGGARKKKVLPTAWITFLSEKYNISADWLLYGTGQMYRGDESYGEFTGIPLAEARLSAGDGSVVSVEEFKESYSFKTKWLHKKATAIKNLVLMFVMGDSMEPTLHDRDMLLVDLGRNDYITGAIYAVNLGDDTIAVKRLEFQGDKIIIISDNKFYAPYPKNYTDVRILGQVIWLGREMVRNNNNFK